MLCLSRPAAARAPVGKIDENGLLWKISSASGDFVTTLHPSMDTCYSSLAVAVQKFAELPMVGSRPVLTRTKVDGFEKLTLGPYEYLTYAQYFSRVEAIGAGLSGYLSAGDTAMIYADTQLEWMLSAFGCWRNGSIVATCYATLGEEGALFAINQSRAKLVIADAKLLRVLANSARSSAQLSWLFSDSFADGPCRAHPWQSHRALRRSRTW